MANLFDLTYRVAQLLGIISRSVATGGGTTSIVDTNFLKQSDDYWGGTGFNMGTAWILYDSAGASAAPEGEYARVSDFDNATNTATLADTLTAAVASGDHYAIAPPRYTLQTLIEKINQALIMFGPVPFLDKTSLDSAAAQTEYSLPATVVDLRKVYIQVKTGDTDDNQWREMKGWRVDETSIGSAKLLVFPYQPDSVRDIMIVHVAMHPALNVYTDNLSEYVPIERVATEAAFLAVQDGLQRLHNADPKLNNQLQMLQSLRDSAIVQHPIRIPPHPRPTMIVEDSDYSTLRLPIPWT